MLDWGFVWDSSLGEYGKLRFNINPQLCKLESLLLRCCYRCYRCYRCLEPGASSLAASSHCHASPGRCRADAYGPEGSSGNSSGSGSSSCSSPSCLAVTHSTHSCLDLCLDLTHSSLALTHSSGPPYQPSSPAELRRDPSERSNLATKCELRRDPPAHEERA